MTLKGQCHEIFCFRFLSKISFPRSKNGLKLVCYVNIVYGNLKSENSMPRNLNEIVPLRIRLQV
jgi:hypothetical protein